MLDLPRSLSELVQSDDPIFKQPGLEVLNSMAAIITMKIVTSQHNGSLYLSHLTPSVNKKHTGKERKGQ